MDGDARGWDIFASNCVVLHFIAGTALGLTCGVIPLMQFLVPADGQEGRSLHTFPLPIVDADQCRDLGINFGCVRGAE